MPAHGSHPGPAGPFVVILTGGIASGKTAVSDRFAALGVPVIDTDVIAREVVAPGTPSLGKVTAVFGREILDASGALDRKKMRGIVFSNPSSKQKLEAILHPAIAASVREKISALASDYCILVVPLLVESGSYQWADRVLVVDVSEETQVQRVMARDGSTREQAEAILESQASRAERLAIADDVIENSGDFSALDAEVARLHQRYRQLANTNRPTDDPGNHS